LADPPVKAFDRRDRGGIAEFAEKTSRETMEDFKQAAGKIIDDAKSKARALKYFEIYGSAEQVTERVG